MSSRAKEWTGGDYRKYNDKKYLHHYDLPQGEDLIVTIADIKNELLENKLKGTSEVKLVLYFAEDVKPLALNKKINPTSISKALGTPNTSNWIGGKIALYVGTESRSEDGYAVRIRDYKPKVEEAICEECGQPLYPVKVGDTVYRINKIREATVGKYGKCLCWDCAEREKRKECSAGEGEYDSERPRE